ncbi:MAG: hypothetical protein AW12_02540 [Candidatus Accumulibacter sp. BA-94]|nr:MAG: hypothetical protein AW12_02540 [Candidatus Accumulibacter sp. BA-94]
MIDVHEAGRGVVRLAAVVAAREAAGIPWTAGSGMPYARVFSPIGAGSVAKSGASPKVNRVRACPVPPLVLPACFARMPTGLRLPGAASAGGRPMRVVGHREGTPRASVERAN